MKSSKEKINKIPAPNRGKPPKKIFYALTLLIPVLFFVLLEALLRLFGYGNDYTQWVEPIAGKYVLNPNIARKYFHDIQTVPYSNGDIFDEVKQPNSYRIFVLGESSGAGYPFLPTGSFSRYLQQRLSLVYPDSKIEVINCSMTAINSYTLRDLFPGILREKPDLVLVYAGHNEYYGALGAGSIESLGSSRRLVNFVIALENYKTFQLIRTVVAEAAGLFAGEKRQLTGTLMARMAHDQYIGLGSDVYRRGIDQFQGNMSDILDMASKAHVPVILGTLACNLKDQPPFVSISEGGFPSADVVYKEAQELLARNDWRKADSLFRYAKDLDALRFRAPSEINANIVKMGTEYNDPVLNIDSAFAAASRTHVIGSDLMTDHLHPTLHGYQFIGDLYYREMEKTGNLPPSKSRFLTERQQDSLTVASFPFGRLDTVIGKYRIQLLKNDWPYIAKKDKIPDAVLLHPSDHIDSIAFSLVEDRTDWAGAHKKAAGWYALKNDIPSFIQTMNALIDQYCIVTEYHDYAANILLEKKDFDAAYSFLSRRYAIAPDAFCSKWIGTICLFRNQTAMAEKYLAQSTRLDAKDSQAWYNLAGVYVQEKNYRLALETVDRAIALNDRYSDALELQKKLKEAVR